MGDFSIYLSIENRYFCYYLHGFPEISNLSYMNKEAEIHEASIAENILRIVEDAASQNNLSKIHQVVLTVGQFSGVQPELLHFAFEFINKGTIMEYAEIEIETPPLLLYCKKCETEYLGELEDLRCPACLGEAFDILQGRELTVKAIVGG